MGSIERNLEIWGEIHDWPQNGDEWSDQAAYCDQPYSLWKNALIEEFITPHLGQDRVAIEIGCGHGRWTEAIAGLVRRLHLVDICSSCLDYCRDRFVGQIGIEYHRCNGRELTPISPRSVDFIWSYDVFVHIDPPDILGYIEEISRVLKIGGVAVLHHAGKNHFATLAWTHLLKRFAEPGGPLERLLFKRQEPGWRSHVSPKMMVAWSLKHGMIVDLQFDSWGARKEFNCRLFGDKISVIRKVD